MPNNHMEIISLSQKSPTNICFLVQLQDFKFIYNIGAYDLNWGYLLEHLDVIKSCDFCFISHSDLKYSGGLPFLHEVGFEGRIFATFPVSELSFQIIQSANEDQVRKSLEKSDKIKCFDKKTPPQIQFHKFLPQNKKIGKNLNLESINAVGTHDENQKSFIENSENILSEGPDISKLEDLERGYSVIPNTRFFVKKSVKEVFKKVEKIKFSQPIELSDFVTFSSHSSGTSLGGSILKFQTSKEVIVFCLNSDHRKEGFVGGLDTSALEEANILFLECSNKVEMIKKSDRNNQIYKLIYDSKRIVFFVKFSRLVELVMMITPFAQQYSKKINLASKRAKSFFNTFKKMVEWFNSSNNADLHENNIVNACFEYLTFDKKSTEAEIVIISQEFENCKSTQRLVEKLIIDPNVIVVFTDELSPSNFQNAFIQGQTTFEYMKMKKIISQKDKPVFDDQDDHELHTAANMVDNEELIANSRGGNTKDYTIYNRWYEKSCDFWITDSNKKFAYFPSHKRLRFDEYGEVFHYTGENSEGKFQENQNDVENAKKEIQKAKRKNREISVKNIRKTLQINCSYEIIDFSGGIEIESLKNILKNYDFKRIIFFNKNYVVSDINSKYFSRYFPSEPINNRISIPIETFTSQIKIHNRQIENCLWRDLKTYQITPIEIFVDEDGKMDIKPTNLGLCISSLSKTDLKNDLVNENFFAVVKNDDIVVNSALTIRFSENKKIYFQGSFDGLYQAVRNVLYKRIKFL